MISFGSNSTLRRKRTPRTPAPFCLRVRTGQGSVARLRGARCATLTRVPLHRPFSVMVRMSLAAIPTHLNHSATHTSCPRPVRPRQLSLGQCTTRTLCSRFNVMARCFMLYSSASLDAIAALLVLTASRCDLFPTWMRCGLLAIFRYPTLTAVRRSRTQKRPPQ